jgi:NAD(P)H-hydrate epimerase
MELFNRELLSELYVPPADSHKGQNGKLMIIGGSELFHAASLWALTIASRIVDMVFYSSVPENNEIVERSKSEFRNGIVVRRVEIEDYIQEADAVLIGPGMLRSEKDVSSIKYKVSSIKDVNDLEDEGMQSYFLTRYLLEKYPHKKWVIDAGALQMMEPEWLIQLEGRVVMTPHAGEFERAKFRIQNSEFRIGIENLELVKQVEAFVKEYKCIVLLKGEEDLVCSSESCVRISGGNAGMTKGGTGDVLSGLVAGLACKNDLWISALAGSYFNKKAGESLYKKVGYYFNASDLAEEIPRIMREEMG